jgi:hypothetical protein
MTQNSFDFPAVAREIHHFFWVPPFFNSHCKQRDEGLMCRDHALVITALLMRLGLRLILRLDEWPWCRALPKHDSPAD